MRNFLWIGAWLISATIFAQTRLVIEGSVIDAKTREPLSFATISVQGRPDQTISRPDGRFQFSVPNVAIDDTLIVTYIGYSSWLGKISQLRSNQVVELTETYTMLNEMVISSWKFKARDIDKVMRPIRGKLYAMDGEVTNAEYNAFLAWLEDHNQNAQLEKYKYRLSSYDKATSEFFRRYAAPRAVVAGKRDSSGLSNDRYPAVNVTWEGAMAYCEWLTEQYNTAEKKKRFKKVLFRLPTLNEWQIAALGDDDFQSWTLRENFIEVIVGDDSLAILPKHGLRKRIPVDDDILYPWWGAYYYRNKAQNHKNCWLGNFLIKDPAKLCPANNPAFDGFSMMGRTRSYFPNNIGLFDVVGNVAEMINEKGKACGGSWNDPPEESTLHSVKTFQVADKSVGFRVFMEVVD